ncbi:MAG TPA: ferrous iron transport protein A [Actinobacteria bacterium]|jgi:Fe2+ transport system protein FeoA|nr:ferrous iron transport protein A [Actinomycetota bacterium]
MFLNEIKPKNKCRIINIVGNDRVCTRLLDMGCMRGEEIEVIRVAPLGDPIDIKIKGYHLSLRKEEAKNIEVESI